MGDFRKKNILQTDFEGKKILQGTTLQKKLPTDSKKYISKRTVLEKNLTVLLYVRKKISVTRVFGGKNSYPNQITHTPTHPLPPSLSKVKCSTRLRGGR